MIHLLDPKTKNLKIIHLEDDPISQRIVHDLIKVRFKNVDLIQNDSGISICYDLPFEKPDIIIVDWILKDCVASSILNTLKRHKGLVIFFSGSDIDNIKSCIKEHFKRMPGNFKVFSKAHGKPYDKLMREIKAYSNEIDKKI